ncbi:Suppression of tumorigenicity 5 protein [Pelomyxa schiedti]|nr:Suppression of tumorigenicity 5 protein [Pelomyxa schiedti]
MSSSGGGAQQTAATCGTPERCFTQALVLSLEPACSIAPKVLYTFPPTSGTSAIPRNIGLFCYPDADVMVNEYTNPPPVRRGSSSLEPVSFTVAVSDDSSGRKYGFIRRFVVAPPGPPKSFVCICFVTTFPWFSMFRELLTIAESRYQGGGWASLLEILTPLYNHPVPPPRGAFNFSAPSLVLAVSPSNPPQTLLKYTLWRPSETESGVPELSGLVQKLGVGRMLALFAALIAERKVAFLGSDLDRLSKAVYGGACILYPFTWQHVFIPILPYSMLSCIEGPMPFMIGILQQHFTTKLQMALKDALIVDTDSGELQHTIADDISILPPTHAQNLRQSLTFSHGVIENGCKNNQAIVDIFRAFFVKTLGNYHRFIQVSCEPPGVPAGTFDKSGFLRSHPMEKQFLSMFLSKSMCEQFIHGRQQMAVQRKRPNDAFEQCCLAEYPPHSSPPPSSSTTTEHGGGLSSFAGGLAFKFRDYKNRTSLQTKGPQGLVISPPTRVPPPTPPKPSQQSGSIVYSQQPPSPQLPAHSYHPLIQHTTTPPLPPERQPPPPPVAVKKPPPIQTFTNPFQMDFRSFHNALEPLVYVQQREHMLIDLFPSTHQPTAQRTAPPVPKKPLPPNPPKKVSLLDTSLPLEIDLPAPIQASNSSHETSPQSQPQSQPDSSKLPSSYAENHGHPGASSELSQSPPAYRSNHPSLILPKPITPAPIPPGSGNNSGSGPTVPPKHSSLPASFATSFPFSVPDTLCLDMNLRPLTPPHQSESPPNPQSCTPTNNNSTTSESQQQQRPIITSPGASPTPTASPAVPQSAFTPSPNPSPSPSPVPTVFVSPTTTTSTPFSQQPSQQQQHTTSTTTTSAPSQQQDSLLFWDPFELSPTPSPSHSPRPSSSTHNNTSSSSAASTAFYTTTPTTTKATKPQPQVDLLL